MCVLVYDYLSAFGVYVCVCVYVRVFRGVPVGVFVCMSECLSVYVCVCVCVSVS
jgi:hypothetical protein